MEGLGGYLHVVCQNPSCGFVNKVPYSKLHEKDNYLNSKLCFSVNTKLGTGECF